MSEIRKLKGRDKIICVIWILEWNYFGGKIMT